MAVNFTIPSKTIKVGDGDFTVRGMNSEDVVFISQVYWEDIVSAVAEHGKKHKAGVIPKNHLIELVMEVAKSFPSLSADIIARCADAPEQTSLFRSLSFVKQVEAIKAIFELSVEDGHELKKWMQGLASLLEANGLQFGPLTNQLKTIIGKSANQSAT